MLPIKEWLETPEVKKLRDTSDGEMYSREFFRDPFRSIYNMPDTFLSPADGVVLYAEKGVKADETILNVKGRKLTVRELLDDEKLNGEFIVIGIFMTRLDVHINRMPTSGYILEEHVTPYLFTPNFSMKAMEEDLIEDGRVRPEDLGYLFPNERCIMTVRNPNVLKGEYFLIQIAERDVDEILNWGEDEHMTQGEKYGLVRFGSQVDFILPLSDQFDYEVVAKKDHHVTAGVDPIVRITNDKRKGLHASQSVFKGSGSERGGESGDGEVSGRESEETEEREDNKES